MIRLSPSLLKYPHLSNKQLPVSDLVSCIGEKTDHAKLSLTIIIFIPKTTLLYIHALISDAVDFFFDGLFNDRLRQRWSTMALGWAFNSAQVSHCSIQEFVIAIIIVNIMIITIVIIYFAIIVTIIIVNSIIVIVISSFFFKVMHKFVVLLACIIC